MAGVTLAAMNVPQALGYTRIAGYTQLGVKGCTLMETKGAGPRGRNNLTSAARLASKMSMKCWLARLKLSKYSLTSRGSSTRASTRYISFSNALKTGERSA